MGTALCLKNFTETNLKSSLAFLVSKDYTQCEVSSLRLSNFDHQNLNVDIASLVRRRGVLAFTRHHVLFPFFLFPGASRTNHRRPSHDHSQIADSPSSVFHDYGLFHFQVPAKSKATIFRSPCLGLY